MNEQPEPHHRIRRPDEVSDELDASGWEWPDDIDQQVAVALDKFAHHAQRPIEPPRRFPCLQAYVAGARQFRHPDGLAPSLAWPSPLDDCWVRGQHRAHSLTGYRFDSGRKTSKVEVRRRQRQYEREDRERS